MDISYQRGTPSKHQLKEGQVLISEEKGQTYLYTKIGGRLQKIKFDRREKQEDLEQVNEEVIDGGFFK